MNRSWLGQIYDDGCFFQVQIAKQVLSNYVFNKNAVILDLGCGSGKVSHYLQSLSPDSMIVAIDKSNSMIEFAKKTYGNKKLLFKKQDILSLSDVNKYTDIVSFNCLHWLDCQNKILQLIQKALKKTGKILFVLPTNHNDVIHHLIEDVANSKKWQGMYGEETYSIHIHSFTDDEYRQFLIKNGFISGHVETLVVKTPFKDTSLLHKFVAALPLFEKCVKQIDIDEFANDVVNEFINRKELDAFGNYYFESSIQIIKANL